MPTTASTSAKSRKDLPGARALDFLDLDNNPASVTGRHRLEVDTSGNLVVKKDTSGNNSSVWRADFSIKGTGGIGIGVDAAGQTAGHALTVGGATHLKGAALIAGNLMPDTVANGISQHSIGSSTAMWYAGHFAELRVAVLVADEQAVTMGGRQLVGLGNILGAAINDAQTLLYLRYNSVKAGDTLYFQGAADDFIAQVEYMKITVYPANEGERNTDGTYKPYKRIWWSTAANAPHAVQPEYLGVGPYNITNAQPAGTTTLFQYSVVRNYESVTAGQTTPVAGAAPNAWSLDTTVFNTGTTGNGFIDIYAQNRLRDMTGTATPAPVVGPAIEFYQRFDEGALDTRTMALVGRLDGKYDYPATPVGLEKYGLVAGSQLGSWFSADTDAAKGVRFMTGSSELAYLRAGSMKVGSLTVTTSYTEIAGWRATASQFQTLDGTSMVLSGTNKKISIDSANVVLGFNADSNAVPLSGVHGLVVVASATTGRSMKIGRFGGTASHGIEIDAANYWKVHEAGTLTSFVVGGTNGITYLAGNLTIGSDASFAGKVAVGTGSNRLLLNFISYVSGTTTALSIGQTAGTNTEANVDTGKFKVAFDGTLTATGANITGTITASLGNIGGFTIGTTTLTSAGDSSFVITAGANASVDAGGVKLGLNVSGTKDGLLIDTANYWLLNGANTEFRVGGAQGINWTTGGTVNLGNDTAVSGSLSVTGEIVVKSGGNWLAKMAPQGTGAVIAVVSSLGTLKTDRYGIRIYDKAGTGQLQWNIFHETAGVVTTTDQKDTTDPFYQYDTKATTSTQLHTKGEAASTSTSNEGTTTIPVAKSQNRLLFTHEGKTTAMLTKEGDMLVAGRLQIGVDDGSETSWGQAAYARMIRSVAMRDQTTNALTGIYRPQWFDGTTWRWLDLGNVASEATTVNWSNIGGRPILPVWGATGTTPGSGGIDGSIDLSSGVFRLSLGSAALSEAEANTKFLRFDVDQTTVYEGQAALQVTDVQRARKNLGLELPINTIWYGSAANVVSTTALTEFARTILDDADSTAVRATLGLGALAVLGSINNSNWSGAPLAVGNGGTGKTAVAVDAILYATAANTYGEIVTTSFGRSFLPLANAAAGRTLLAVPGSATTETISGAWTFTALATFSGDVTTTGYVAFARPLAPAQSGATAILAQSTTGLMTITFAAPVGAMNGGFDGFFVEVQYGGTGDYFPVAYVGEKTGVVVVSHQLTRKVDLAYRIYTLKGGRLSAALTSTMNAATQTDVLVATNVRRTDDFGYIDLDWDNPLDPRLVQVKVWVDYDTVETNMTEARARGRSATYIGTGESASWEIPFALRDNFYKFYVETIARS